MLIVIIDGLFLLARETVDFSDHIGIVEISNPRSQSIPLRNNVMKKSHDSYIISVAEVGDVNSVIEVIKKLEKTSGTKRIVILTLFLCILMSEGVQVKTVLPSIFPWTDIILSRSRVIRYIQRQDGAK
ncbi:MAG: hypothetical protein J5802_14980 [Butyrivibrio sp.]|nr:hypothetical protein [Butyrivibrio sp.]